jgi:hypothetical protein
MRARYAVGIMPPCPRWWDLSELRSIRGAGRWQQRVGPLARPSVGLLSPAPARIWHGKPPSGRSCSSSQSYVNQLGEPVHQPHWRCGVGASSTELSADSRAELRPAYELHAGGSRRAAGRCGR